MSRSYEYVREGVVHGPVTGREIRRLAANGQIGPDDLIRLVGDGVERRWIPARNAKNLRFAGERSPGEDALQRSPPLADAPEQAAERPQRLPRQTSILTDCAWAALWGLLAFVLALPVGFALGVMRSGAIGR